jgi:hypothetical protein
VGQQLHLTHPIPLNLFAGNLKVHLHAFLYTLIHKGWLTRKQLNIAIRRFQWSGGAYVPSVPKATLKGVRGVPKKEGSMPFTSGQMLAFVVQSLTLLRPLLSSTALASAEWAAWAAHVKYFVGLMQSEFTEASIDQVDSDIEDAQELFLALYPHLWKPKNHFAQHIPDDIRRFGPPRTYWCMRFEAKNQEHKRAAKTGSEASLPGAHHQPMHVYVTSPHPKLTSQPHRLERYCQDSGIPLGETECPPACHHTTKIHRGGPTHWHSSGH